MIIKIENRTDLKFKTSKTSMDRSDESYKLHPVNSNKELLIKNIVNQCIGLIDSNFLPKELTFHLEYKAQVEGPDYKEDIPAAMVLSRQIPKDNAVRMGMFELENDEETLKFVIAHEMGHMLPEWISRKSGKTTDDDEVIMFWSKPIYEGIADFTAAYITQNTSLGRPDKWYYRDILAYDQLEDAMNPKEGLDDIGRKGFKKLGLIPNYQFYQNWIDTISMYVQETGMKDPYSEGTWVAGQLWSISDKGTNKKIWKTLEDVAYSGKSFNDSKEFISFISKQL